MKKTYFNLFCKTNFILLLLLQFLLCLESTKAQHNAETFNLQNASELYDERGFMKGKSLSLDGNLVVNNSNGNINYTYPISSFNLHGYPMNVSLNYCGSVAFTAFQAFQPYNMNACAKGWSKTTENKPLWIIGLNGFAVQTISQNTEPICLPSQIQYYWGHMIYGPYVPDVWLVDGYDFCNRMKNLAEFTSPTENSKYVDIIKLLRADGSVLELCNRVDSSNISAYNKQYYPPAYSGKYFEKGTNAKGYAYVELVETRQQSLIDIATEYLTSDIATSAMMMPRIVHYYPGDGLEYIFREDVAPYGAQFYLGLEIESEVQTETDWYGRFHAQHTIFYLDKIRSEKKDLLELNYGDVIPTLSGDQRTRMKGHKQLQDFYGHKFTFSQMRAQIESFGKTVDIMLDTVLRKPVGDSYFAPTILEYGDWEPTCLPMIKKIIDPAGRQISFDYGTKIRTYTGYGWPYKYNHWSTADCELNPGGYTPIFKTRTKRMTRFNEPTAYTQISYFRNDSIFVDEDPVVNDLYQLSEVAKTVVKRNYEGSAMLTKEFSYNIGDSTHLTLTDTPEWYTYYAVTDNITNKKTFSISKYNRKKIEGSELFFVVSGTPSTDLTESIEGTDSIKTKTVTTYDWLHNTTGDSINLRMPVSRTVTEFTSPTDSVRRAYSTFEYVIDTMVHYQMWLAKTHYGFGIARQYENVWRPDTTSKLLYRKITDYQIFPDSLHTMYIVPQWDKIASLTNYYELVRTDPSFTKSWEECIETTDPRVIVPYHGGKIDTVYSYSPAAYLQKASYITDGDSVGYPLNKGKILQGTSRKFSNLYTENSSNILDRIIAIEDTVIGAGGVSYVGSQSIYSSAAVQLPVSIKTTNGALSDYRYEYNRIPSSWGCELDTNSLPIGKIHRNDNTDSIGIVHGGENVLWWHEPLAEAKRIRRYLPGHSGIDTMILPTLFERTYYGLHSGVVDPNGWLTSARYDAIGRLTKLAYPYDFNSASQLIEYEKTIRPVRESGYTVLTRKQYQRRKNGGIVPCNGDWEYRWETKTDYDYSRLYAYAMYTISGGGGEESLIAPDRGKESAALNNDCNWVAADGNNNLWVDSLYYGEIPFRVSNTNIVSLDSAVLEISPTIIDPCFTLFIEGLKPSNSQVLTGSAAFNCDSMFTDTSFALMADTGVITSTHDSKIRIKLSPTLVSEIVSSGLDLTVHLFPSTGYLEGYFHNTGDDVMPHIKLYGVFKEDIDLTDYTLKYTYGDYFGKGRIYRYAKVDDTLHTSSKMAGGWSANDNRRVSLSSTLIADDNCISENVMYRGNPTDNVKEIVSDSTNGLGKVIKVIDQVGYVSRVKYDEFGRVVQVENPDNVNLSGDTNSTVTTAYYVGKPTKFGIGSFDQDFYGYCSVKTVKNEKGVKYSQYFDALGRLRREMADSAGLHYTTKYEYDILGRLTKVTNPQKQVTNYWYDEFGRVKYKKQIDLGTLSYGYDVMGNVRFTQTNEQDSLGKITFHEYDDLNRITVIGEARLGTIDHDTLPNLNRWTDVLDGNKLHDNDNSDILTANKTLWDTSLVAVPYIAANATGSACISPGASYGVNDHYSGVTFKQMLGTVGSDTLTFSDTTNFENIATHPENVRTVIHYDTLPQRAGAVWEHFTPEGMANVWNALTPTGTVRNMKGHEVAVAYRDAINEPFHYVVMSYDERGRVEALMRFTNNIGFDAVYYTYNSANQVIRLTTADGYRQHTTWYGYDWNGRIDSVWTRLGSTSTGLGFTSPAYPTPVAKDSLCIVYHYDKRGLVDSTMYPKTGVTERYKYTARKWLDSMSVVKGNTELFYQKLVFDNAGNIDHQHTKQLGRDRMSTGYTYDAISRLVLWGSTYRATPHSFSYDSVGNRKNEIMYRGLFTKDTNSYEYSNGNNQLTKLHLSDSVYDDYTRDVYYKYTGDGALKIRQQLRFYDWGYHDAIRDVFSYSYNGLLKKFGNSLFEGNELDYGGYCFLDTVSQSQWRWEYRYSAGGERESKRMVGAPLDGLGTNNTHPWTYYLLGGNKQQLAVYNGQETDVANACLDTGHRVHFYPNEYLTYGNGMSALITTRPDGKKEYKIVDHLGSTRVILNDTGGVISQFDYEPFGKLFASTEANPARKGYIDKEVDLESGTSNMGVRQMNPETGRFDQIEPLWEKMYSQSPYTYSFNNPLRLSDPNGKLPGDLFTSASQAAHDFGKNYNPLSIQSNKEFGTAIYEVKKEGVTYFSYVIPDKLGEAGGSMEVSGEKKLVGIAHTHGSYMKKFGDDNNQFSDLDKDKSKELGLPSYVATPNGSLQVYDPKTQKTQTLTKDMPSDPKDPQRLNKIKPESTEARPTPYMVDKKLKEEKK